MAFSFSRTALATRNLTHPSRPSRLRSPSKRLEGACAVYHTHGPNYSNLGKMVYNILRFHSFNSRRLPMKCLNCLKETPNPKFCSRSCAATYNNRKHPKRKPEHKCTICGERITAGRSRCSQHRIGRDMTLAEAIYTQHHRSSAFALVRSRARKVALQLGRTTCQHCGYNLHVEVCHRKPIADFPEDTLLSVVNHPDNLIVLCPNHHWEFDNGLLQL